MGPWDSQIFTTIKKVTGTSRNGLKSVTISKQGRRNGFFKGSPLDWGPGAPWGLHGWAPGIHKFLPQSKTLLAPLENGLKSVTINKLGRRNGLFKGRPLDGGPGAPWGLHGWAPGIHNFLPQSKRLLAPLENGLKSVTINKLGRRNGFSKVAPWRGSMGAPWGLHGRAPWVHRFLSQSKTLLAPLEISHNK